MAFHLFTLAGIPVYVSVWYLALVAFIAWSQPTTTEAIVAPTIITIGLLVHEFGHGFAARRFRLGPKILLEAYAGLCQHAPTPSDKENALVVAAGPGAGFVLAGVSWVFFEILAATSPGSITEGVWLIREWLLFFNFYWGLANCLPLWPLDGGHLFEIGARRLFKLTPQRSQQITHLVGAVTGVAGAIFALSIGFRFAAIIAALLVFENVRRLDLSAVKESVARSNKMTDQGGVFIKALAADMEAALEAQDWREAVRLAHQLRDQADLPPKLLQRAWAVLVIANTEQGEYADALDYVPHAPKTPEVLAAQRRCIEELGEGQ